jgi:hypothetical protein
MIQPMVKVMPLSAMTWRVVLSPGEQPFEFPTKAQAISFAIAWAELHRPCDVRVYGGVGAPDRSMTVPNGDYRRTPGSDRRQRQADIPFFDRRRHERRNSGSTSLPFE